MIELGHSQISLRRQCQLIGLSRSTLYYQPAQESQENLELMRLIDEQYTQTPFYGSRRMSAWLSKKGYPVNRKRIQRLMRKMGIEAIYPKPRTTVAGKEHKIYPYLLDGLSIIEPNQVWSTDITYIPMARGFMYLVAVIDWFSRYVISWRLSNTLSTSFCLEALEEALLLGRPSIFNTDQGSQFTSLEFTERLKKAEIEISMDGRGRCLDNVFIERLWRSVKYEDVYLKNYETVPELSAGLYRYFRFYNEERPHQSLGYETPFEIHYGQTRKNGGSESEHEERKEEEGRRVLS